MTRVPGASRPTIIVTGAQGQVGWELQRALLPLGRIVAVDLAELDLTDLDAVRRFVRETRPQVIVNPAAHTAVDRAEAEPELAHRLNAEVPGLLAEEARRLGAVMVHYSTDYVFDGTGSRPYREDDSPNPRSVYGRTKLAGEHAVTDVGGRHTILRLAWVYGARGNNFLRTMLRLGSERDLLRVVDDQRGAPAWCRAVAEASSHVVRDHLEGRDRATGLFHLPAGGETTWYGFAKAIFEGAAPALLARVPQLEAIATAEYPTPAQRPSYSVLDGSKAAAALGLRLPGWEEQLSCVLNELREMA